MCTSQVLIKQASQHVWFAMAELVLLQPVESEDSGSNLPCHFEEIDRVILDPNKKIMQH
jgi:hypothetical protein